MLKFVTADAHTIGQKRKQVVRACEACRKRKKRCHHTEDADPSASDLLPNHLQRTDDSVTQERNVSPNNKEPPLEVELPNQSGQGMQSAQNVTSDTAGSPATVQVVDGSPRPQSLGSRFVGDLNPEGVFLAATTPQDDHNSSTEEGVGMWLARKREKRAQRSPDSRWPQSSLTDGLSPMVKRVVIPVLEEECLSLLPPPESREALTSFYFDKVHPILPVIDEPKFRSMQASDPSYVLLQQGICLVASMNPSMEKHLRLSSIEQQLPHREFAKRLFSAMRILTDIGLVTDKIVLIQALTLMWMFMDGPEARDVSSMMCARAVQYAQSLGLHVHGKHHKRREPFEDRLLSCVWAVDRLNAAYHGRPVLMHERDFGRDITENLEGHSPCARLFLLVISWLDKVIGIYRPSRDSRASSEMEVGFQSFEDLLVQSNALQAPIHLLATIEVLYHSVAMLSFRPRPTDVQQQRSAAYFQRYLAAERVTSLVGVEYRGQLVQFPFVPYAVSLSLSIAYAEMRHTIVPMYRTRARNKVQDNCELLEQLGEIFYLAALMAEMGKSTLTEYDRVYSTVVDSHQRSRAGSHAPMNLMANHSQGQPQDHSQLNSEQTHLDNLPMMNNGLGAEHQNHHEYDQGFDVDGIPNFDVFEMFDPSFDLNGIDFHLEGNLDPSFPISFQ